MSDVGPYRGSSKPKSMLLAQAA